MSCIHTTHHLTTQTQLQSKAASDQHIMLPKQHYKHQGRKQKQKQHQKHQKQHKQHQRQQQQHQNKTTSK